MAAGAVPTVRLNNGYEMPILGFGTANAYNEEIINAVHDAINAGYRHFDGAMFYANEPQVGEAIRAKIDDGSVQRKDLFIVSKLWCSFMSPHLVENALKKSLQDLQLDYLDLYLIHWPTAFEENMGFIPKDDKGNVILKNVDYLDTWKAMEMCVTKGLVRSIGVSNFNSQQMKRLISHCRIKPVTNQVEMHPYLTQKPLIKLCSEWDVVVTAYGPLGRPGLSQDAVNDPVVLEDPMLKEMAIKYERTVAQILLRYLTIQNIPVVPKSSNKTRIIENMASLLFEMSPQDVTAIDSLNRNYRLLRDAHLSSHPHYPFHIDY